MDSLKKTIIPLLNKLPYIRTLNKLLRQYEEVTAYPPGHYYSPIPDVKELTKEATSLFDNAKPEAIEFKEEKQLELFHKFIPYYKEFPFTNTTSEKYRYSVPESFFTYTDAVILYSMIRSFEPKKIVEIGSGYSSALMLDINQYYFNQKQQLTFIDPDFRRLKKLMKSGDEDSCSLVEKKVQESNPDYFLALDENDLLFIDSSHVSKTGSDLNYLIFKILPLLKKGVIIHFHDVYYPFEYPSELVLEKKLAWNEAYLLRAFLMYNPMFEIVYFNNYIYEKHIDLLKEKMPEFMKDEGASLYIRKIK
jgi:predicted O-methyltransferase YrrM